VAALAGIVAVLPKLADGSDRECNAGPCTVAHDITDGRIVFPMAADQWFRISSEIEAQAR
jgi:hypothetical protein